MKIIKRLKNILIFEKSEQHMVYVNDLTINLGRLNLLLMWKLTENGKTIRKNYLSFNCYFDYKQIFKVRF